MDEDLLLNIYEETQNARSASSSLVDNLESCGERYRDLKALTSGGMKDVFSCYDSHTESQVILVTPKTPSLNESFVREGRINAFLQHPNIIAVYDVGLLPNERPFFTMKFLEGKDFDQYLKERADLGDMAELIGYFIKVCDAVNYAHSRGIVHLDLKPANIRIGSFGEVVVCDWGIAELIYDVDDSHESFLDKDLEKILLYRKPVEKSSLSGTPGYIAPERYENTKASFHHDIYSLGAILFDILSGEAPKESRPAQKAPALTFTAHIPLGLIAICQKSLAPNPDERYESMDGMVSDLRRYVSGFATKAENAGLLRQLGLLYRRNRGFCLLLTVSIVLLTLIVSISFYRVSENRQIAVSEKETALKAKKETEMLLGKLLVEQQRSVELMELASESQLVIAQQKLNFQLYEDCHKAFELAKKLDPASANIRRFEAKLMFAHLKWTEAESLYTELKNAYAVKLIRKLKELSRRGMITHFDEIQKFLGRSFMIYFLENNLGLAEDLQGKAKLYTWLLRTKHLGMRHLPNVIVIEKDGGVEVTFKDSLAVKSIDPLKYLNPVRINLANSGLIYETGLKECQNLKELNLSGTGMLGAGRLELENLEKLDISHTSFNDSKQFSGLPKLRELDVSYTRIHSFEGFLSLKELALLIVDPSQFKQARRVFPKLLIKIRQKR
jgi:serine/threonine protein kinase